MLSRIIFALITATLLTACDPGPVKPVDFAKLERARNSYLVAPDGFTPGKSDGEAPVLGMSAEKLKASWGAMIARQPNVEKVAESADGLQIDYVQRSKVLHIPDWITVRFIPMPSDPETGDYATLAVYTRSATTSHEAQAERVTKWLSGL